MRLPILSRDTPSKIEAARTSLATAQTRLADLERERAEALAGDDVSVLHRIGAAIAQQNAIVRDLSDRVAALKSQKRVEDNTAALRAQTEGIDKIIVPAAAECAALATELEGALARAAELLDEIEEKRQAVNRLPPGVPRPQFSYGASFELLSVFVPTTTQVSVPGNSLLVNGQQLAKDIKRAHPGTAVHVREKLDRWIAELRRAPLPAPPADIEEAA